MHANVHAYIEYRLCLLQKDTHACMHAHTHAHTHTHTHTHGKVCYINASNYTGADTHSRTCIHAYPKHEFA